MENVNAVMVLLEHHSVAQILMNVPIKFVIRVHFVKIHQDHLNVCVQNKLSVIHTQLLVVCYQINVYEMRIALKTWLVSKENVQNHVALPNADEMQFAKQTIIKHSACVHQEILVIQLIRLLVASASNVLAAKIAVQINSVIHRSINVKVSIPYQRFLKLF